MTLSCPLCHRNGTTLHSDIVTISSYTSCNHCELIWRDRSTHLKADEEFTHYLQHKNDPKDANYRAFLNRLWLPLKEKLQSNATGLDYGSGPGPALHLMAQEDGFACTHYDPFFHPDQSTLEKKYDFITCSETAEHFCEPAVEFRQLRDLLKPNGILAIMTSLHDTVSDFSKWHYRLDPTYVSFYSSVTFNEIQKKFGFHSVSFPGKNVILLRR